LLFSEHHFCVESFYLILIAPAFAFDRCFAFRGELPLVFVSLLDDGFGSVPSHERLQCINMFRSLFGVALSAFFAHNALALPAISVNGAKFFADGQQFFIKGRPPALLGKPR
jgi:hypothetical protein